jgi:hypothetical protein
MGRLHQYTLHHKNQLQNRTLTTKILVGMLLNTHQYYVTFLLTDLVTFAHASSLTKNPFDICSPVDILLVSKEAKPQEIDFQICYDTFYTISYIYIYIYIQTDNRRICNIIFMTFTVQTSAEAGNFKPALIA